MSPRTKIALNVIGGLLLAVMAVAFGINPILFEVRSLNSELAEKQKELDKIEKQILEFKSAQNDLAKATYKNDIYNTVVIREDLSSVITQLEAAAKQTNTVESIQIQETDTKETRRSAVKPKDVFTGLVLSKEVNYGMNVKSEYEDFVRFLQYLENLPHFTEFSAINLNSVVENLPNGDGGTSNTGGVTGSLEGVFLVKENAQK